MKVENLSEAQAAATALAEFLGRFARMLGPSAGLKESRPEGGNEHPTPPPQPTRPKETAERVFYILKEAGRPMSPKAMAARDHALGWSTQGDRKTYSALLSSAYYLVRKGKLHKDANGYSLIPQ
jgi:hypothetical protein